MELLLSTEVTCNNKCTSHLSDGPPNA